MIGTSYCDVPVISEKVGDSHGAVYFLMGCLREGLFGVQSDWHKLL